MADVDPDKGLARLFGFSPKELDSERFYQNRELPYTDLYKYGTECNKILVKGQTNRMKDLCKRVLKYLEKSKIWKKNESGYDECILLNYWVYDKIDKYYNNKTDDMDTAFSGLQLIWSYLVEDKHNNSYFNKCMPLFEMFKHNDWKQRKELYDYYVDFNYIFNTAMYYTDRCREFHKKIEDKTSLYKYFDEQCTPEKDNCPEFYDKCKDYNPKSVLHKLPCHQVILSERADAEKVFSLKHSAEQQRGSEPHTSSTELPQENSSIGTKVGNSVLGVAPVLLTASVLYRYTPIGPWIRKLGGINQNSMSDIDVGEVNGFLGNTQESGDILFGDTGNYISYQPM
ncbi:PIR Superfamily Protein [Plasmodium ovale curtisi]|uniref:PIR Superfamily Protein n=1 Tax=Plasmodium ovale curtisi TaxID=864141 RepID=A0A1A8XC57_PLAOA|nr:PIR Superfamily Protein [Plasmodium ovale curtisi]